MSVHNWALVIQGPMVSYPPPKSWLHQVLAEHEREGQRAYEIEQDCARAIAETVRLAAPAVRQVVLSTWSDDANADIALRTAGRLGCDLVLSEDPGMGTWTWGRVPDNRWRQILSTMRALDRVRIDTSITHVIRTRTDQIIDVPAIVAAVEGQEGDPRPCSVGQRDYIYVPGVFESVPYAIDDFYFAGWIEDLRRFFSAQWEQRTSYRGVDSVHVDLVMKHVAGNLSGLFPRKVLPFELFPVVDATRDLNHMERPDTLGGRYLRLWSDILELSIKPLPRTVYENIVFRGVPYRLRFGRMFLEEWLSYRDDIGAFFRSRYPCAFARGDFGVRGMLLNYAPECAFLDQGGAISAAAHAAHVVRRVITGRYRSIKPEQLT
jgi:hypothetical protein